MPSSNKPLPASSPDLPDKDHLYGEFTKWFGRQMRFAEKLKHKSLDLPMDDDAMNNVGNKHGLAWKELAVIGGLGLVGYHLATRQPEPLVTPPDPPPAASEEHHDTTRGVDIERYTPTMADLGKPPL